MDHGCNLKTGPCNQKQGRLLGGLYSKTARAVDGKVLSLPVPVSASLIIISPGTNASDDQGLDHVTNEYMECIVWSVYGITTQYICLVDRLIATPICAIRLGVVPHSSISNF